MDLTACSSLYIRQRLLSPLSSPLRFGCLLALVGGEAGVLHLYLKETKKWWDIEKWSCFWSRLPWLGETWLSLMFPMGDYSRQELSISWGNAGHVLTVISQVNYIALCTDIISDSLRVLATFSVRQVCLNMTALLNRERDVLLETPLTRNSLPDTIQAFLVHKARQILHRQWHLDLVRCGGKIVFGAPQTFLWYSLRGHSVYSLNISSGRLVCSMGFTECTFGCSERELGCCWPLWDCVSSYWVCIKISWCLHFHDQWASTPWLTFID